MQKERQKDEQANEAKSVPATLEVEKLTFESHESCCISEWCLM